MHTTAQTGTKERVSRPVGQKQGIIMAGQHGIAEGM